MPVFTCKCFPSTGKKYRCQYQVLAETERFVWLARDHTLYPYSWSKWKLLLNKITAGDVQQAKQWTQKLSLPLATKLGLITVCKGWVVSTRLIVFPHISTEERVHHYSETRYRSNVSGAYTCWKTLIKLTFSTERLYKLTERWYRNISLLPLPRTSSLNSLVEALILAWRTTRTGFWINPLLL